MPLEIERKFLVTGDFRPHATACHRIIQAYLCADGHRTVRVRLRDDVGFLTIKGPSLSGGLARYEFEKQISPDEALSLLRIALPGAIDKERFLVPAGQHTFEVDVFHGDNEGLVIAEVELRSENEPFARPDWLGPEVTGQSRYYNAALSRKPFKEWGKEVNE